jgi:hypothetical protein
MADNYMSMLDVITPEIFNQYMENLAVEKSAFIRSGVAVADPRVSNMINSGNTMVNMPFWNDLYGDDEVIGDGDKALSTGKMNAGSDIAQVMYRGRGWAVNEMAAVLSGADPLGSLMSKIAEYWFRREQQVLMSTLHGLFADTNAALASHLLKVNSNISAKAVLDAKQLLGDRADSLALIVMHSATYTELQKQELIEFIQPATGGKQLAYYLGYEVVVDDALEPDADGVYTTYLLAAGSFGRNTGNPSHLTTFETYRDAAKGTDQIFTRRAFVMHPYGVKWTNAAITAGALTATNADLENPKNHEAVYDLKKIGVVGLQHTVGEAPVDNGGTNNGSGNSGATDPDNAADDDTKTETDPTI